MIPETMELDLTQTEMGRDGTGPNAPLRADGSPGMSLSEVRLQFCLVFYCPSIIFAQVTVVLVLCLIRVSNDLARQRSLTRTIK
jgi:hypothetical protein